MTTISVSAIITAHREGLMAGLSVRSLREAVDAARCAGIEVECLANLDRPDHATRAVFCDLAATGWKISETDFGDQGLARNHIVQLASCSHVAFLDADDLWGWNWLTEGVNLCRQDPKRFIVHPEYNWFFDSSNNLFIHCDQDHPAFTHSYLRFANYWDALCLAPRKAHLDHPYSKRDVEAGFAYEDWHWNCETLTSGYRHKVAERTIHFKRRRLRSQTLEASGNKCLMRDTDLLHFNCAAPP